MEGRRRSARGGAAAARRWRREEVPVRPGAPEEGRPTEAETMVLPLTPNEALVVDVARGLDSGSLIEQAHRILKQAPYSVGYHREEGNVEGFVWACVLAILSVSLRLEVRRGEPGGSVTRSWCACESERLRGRSRGSQ